MIQPKKMLITPEKAAKQKKLFNPRFGYLKFYIVISYSKTNVFFSFYCKASRFRKRVFLFRQYSLGLEKRDEIRAGTLPKVNQRGRRKNQLYQMYSKFNLLKEYVVEFIRNHPRMLAFGGLHVIWKLYTFDVNINTLLTDPFELRVYRDFKFVGVQDPVPQQVKKWEKPIKNENFKKQIEPYSAFSILNIDIIHNIKLKFPHNGCRPKKIRRTKKSRRRRNT